MVIETGRFSFERLSLTCHNGDVHHECGEGRKQSMSDISVVLEAKSTRERCIHVAVIDIVTIEGIWNIWVQEISKRHIVSYSLRTRTRFECSGMPGRNDFNQYSSLISCGEERTTTRI